MDLYLKNAPLGPATALVTFLVVQSVSTAQLTVENGTFDDESNFLAADGVSVPVSDFEVGLWIASPQNFGAHTDADNPAGVANWTNPNPNDVVRSIYQIISVPDTLAATVNFNYSYHYDPGVSTATNRRWNVTVYGVRDDETPGWFTEFQTGQMPFGTTSNPIEIAEATSVETLVFDEPGFAAGSGQTGSDGFQQRTLSFTLAGDQYDFIVVRFAGRTSGEAGDREVLQFDDVGFSFPLPPDPRVVEVINGTFDDESNFQAGAAVDVDITDSNIGIWVSSPQFFGAHTDADNPAGVANWTNPNANDVVPSIYQVIPISDVVSGDLSFEYDYSYDLGSSVAMNRRWNATLYGIKDDMTPGWAATLSTGQMPFGPGDAIPVVSDVASVVELVFDEPGFVGGVGQEGTQGFVSTSIPFTLLPDEFDFLVVRLSGRVNQGTDGETLQFDNVRIVTPVTTAPRLRVTAFDPVLDEITLQVSGVPSGQLFHLRVSTDLQTFVPVPGTEFSSDFNYIISEVQARGLPAEFFTVWEGSISAGM